jgi:CRISPR-associated protein Cmr3
MMFRGPGEFDPSARGVQSYASSFDMPSPSTIAGAVATYILNTNISNVKKFGIPNWVEQCISVLGSDTIIRGPLILFEDEIMVEDRIGGCFLSLNEAKEKCEKIKKNLEYKVDSLAKLDDIMSFGKIETKSAHKSAKHERIGVGLTTRSKSIKIADEDLGLLFNAVYTDYLHKDMKKPNELREAAIEIIIEVKNAKITPNHKPIKLGGEGRIVLLSSSKTAVISEKIRKTLWNEKENHNGNLACYLATPALFKGGKTIDKQVSEWAEGLKSKLTAIYGETDILGAGFSLYHQKRKPIYSSLKPGSVIFLEGKFNLNELYWKPNFGEASELGYGTLIPIIL